MNIIAYTDPATQRVCFCIPKDETPEILALALAENIPANAQNIRVIDSATVNPDRTFRNAWIQVGAAIQTDLPKARAIVAIKNGWAANDARLLAAGNEIALKNLIA
jgi:hypothetical protein